MRAMCDMLSQASRNHARQLQYTIRGSLLSLPLLLSLVIFFYTINFLPHISALERRLISGFRLSGAERSKNQEHIETHLSS